MGAKNHTRQDKYATSSRRSGKMAVLTRCGACDRSVVGVIMREQPGRYCMECKGCGYSATSRFSEAGSPPSV
jgi:hypothetical protein